jgi:DNA-directed RNA polymerase subunit alpha
MESLNVNAKNWKALIKPTQLDVSISDDKSHAKIIAEPLEKGYGLTLGNSLRRILLLMVCYTNLHLLKVLEKM